MTIIYQKLGETVRNLRKNKKLSQEQLAELTKVDPKSIIAIEAGQRNPTLKTINKIARALKVSLKDLL